MTCKEKLKADHPTWTEAQLESIIKGTCPGIVYLPAPVNGCDNTTCDECWEREIPEKDGNIKTSGSTTEFDTGAHRDAREGKGRCDLIPLEVAAEWLKDDVLGCISQFQIQGTTTFLYGALNHFCATAYPDRHTSKIESLLEVAKHYEEGGKRYGDNNWKNGMPVHIYIDSAVRHYLKFLRGDKDEPHDRAFVWNVMCCIWEVDFHNKED
jgi:hypothetical protein